MDILQYIELASLALLPILVGALALLVKSTYQTKANTEAFRQLASDVARAQLAERELLQRITRVETKIDLLLDGSGPREGRRA